MLKEFKEFAIKGNMVDLAVGVIIGGAFNSIVNSLVEDIIMPILSVFTGKLDFTNVFYALDGGTYATLAEAQELGVATINYGSFISGIINFIIMAFIVFLIVRSLNNIRKKEEPVQPATVKTCPYCYTDIHIDATVCPNCTSKLS